MRGVKKKVSDADMFNMNRKRYIYVCAPYRGDPIQLIENIKKTRKRCRDIIAEGHIPVAPQLYCPQFLDEQNPDEREIGLNIGLQALKYCDEIRVYGDTITEGMKGEIELARTFIGCKIVYVKEDD